MLRLIQRIVRWTGYWFFFFVKNFNVKFVQAYYYYYTTIVSWFELFFFFFSQSIETILDTNIFVEILHESTMIPCNGKYEISKNRWIELLKSSSCFILYFFFFLKRSRLISSVVQIFLSKLKFEISSPSFAQYYNCIIVYSIYIVKRNVY